MEKYYKFYIIKIMYDEAKKRG